MSNEQRSVWAIVFELPDGEHVLACGPCTKSKSRRVLQQWLEQHPESIFDLDKTQAVDQFELRELTEEVKTRNERRKPLREVFGGRTPMLAFHQPHRVPGSRVPPPQPVLSGGGWGSLSRW